MFASRMASIKRDASCFDVAEKALYNTVLAGLSQEGTEYFYVNPLEVWPQSCMAHTSKAHVKTMRQKWFDVACCPSNIQRTLASLGKYVFQLDEASLYINLYIGNHATFSFNGIDVGLDLETTFLADGKSRLTLHAPEPANITLHLRIPSYVRSYRILINGAEAGDLPVNKGYLAVDREWVEGDVLDVAFDIRAEFIAANPEVRADAGRVAIQKGPMVYCLEEVDNGDNLASVVVDPAEPLVEHFKPDLFGGTSVLKFTARKISRKGWNDELYKPAIFQTEAMELTAIPYCHWGNRGENEMIVWMHAKI